MKVRTASAIEKQIKKLLNNIDGNFSVETSDRYVEVFRPNPAYQYKWDSIGKLYFFDNRNNFQATIKGCEEFVDRITTPRFED